MNNRMDKKKLMEAAEMILEHCKSMNGDCYDCPFMAGEEFDGTIDCGFYGDNPYASWHYPMEDECE